MRAELWVIIIVVFYKSLGENDDFPKRAISPYVKLRLSRFSQICLKFADFLGRLQPLVTTPENLQIEVILRQNEARGDT